MMILDEIRRGKYEATAPCQEHVMMISQVGKWRQRKLRSVYIDGSEKEWQKCG